MMSKPVALTIAGSDPTGGAGLQADLKTFAAHDVHGASVASVLTAQNACRFEVLPVSSPFIMTQIEAVFEAFSVQAIKIGMLGNIETVVTVIEALKRFNPDQHIPVVLDPVIRASNGGLALEEEGVRLLREELVPLTTLIKPNIAEAAVILGDAEASHREEMIRQAERLVKLGSTYVLLSGGHLAGAEAIDILSSADQTHIFSSKKIEIPDIHGTGCSLTSSITANLAKGLEVVEAVELARTYLAGLLVKEPQLDRHGLAISVDHLALKVDKSNNS